MTRVTLPRDLARKLVCGSSRSESTLKRFPGRSEQSLGGPGRAVVVGAMCVVLFAGLSTEFRWKSVVVRLSGRSVITRVLPMRAPEREIVGVVTVQSRRWFAAIFGALICPLNKG